MAPPVSERDRLQNLHLALEAALEQLTYAQQIATQGSSIDAPPAEVPEIEKLAGQVTTLRNSVREKLMKSLSKPTLNILK